MSVSASAFYAAIYTFQCRATPTLFAVFVLFFPKYTGLLSNGSRSRGDWMFSSQQQNCSCIVIFVCVCVWFVLHWARQYALGSFFLVGKNNTWKKYIFLPGFFLWANLGTIGPKLMCTCRPLPLWELCCQLLLCCQLVLSIKSHSTVKSHST